MKTKQHPPTINRYVCTGFARETDKSPIVRYESYSAHPVEAMTEFRQHLRDMGVDEKVSVWKIA